MKIMSVLSVIFSLVFLTWFVLFVNSNGRISVEEFSMIGMGFILWSIVFSVAAMIHFFRKPTAVSQGPL